jgi:hypothetical protein
MSIEPTITREPPPEPESYDPPRIEIQFTAEALEQEILYAGAAPSTP